MAKLHTSLRCRRTKVRVLGGTTPTDRDALRWLMPCTLALEPKAAPGQTTSILPTALFPTADPTRNSGHSSPNITRSGPPCTSLVPPTMPQTSRKYHREAGRLKSSTRRDPTTPCQHLSAEGSILTTGSAIMTYACSHISIIFHKNWPGTSLFIICY